MLYNSGTKFSIIKIIAYKKNIIYLSMATSLLAYTLYNML